MDSFRSLLCTLMLVTSYHTVTCSTREEIRMPGVKPPTEDYYVCTSVPVTEEKYITQYEAIAKASTAHHIILFGCDQPFKDTPTWQCGPTCAGESSIMFAWAKNAPPTKLPDNVGFHIGGRSKVQHIVMQVHYLRALADDEPADHSGVAITTTTDVPIYSQGIMLLVSGYGAIPPHQPVVNIDVTCHYNGKKIIHPFAYRTHAHTLSTVISAYRKANPEDEWEQLGKGNPQWPQSFYPMKEEHQIHPHDIVAGRCVYNSTKQDTVTYIGSTHNDEMCNFYMMYYVEGEAEFIQCAGNHMPKQAKSLPADSLVKLPPDPVLDEMAGGHHHHHHPVDEPAEATVAPSFHVKVDGNDVPYMVEAEGFYTPPEGITMGKIGGLDTDSKGNLIVFHRGSHNWDRNTFDFHDVYKHQDGGAIPEKTLVMFDSSGNTNDSWGDNMFYLPHGLTIDKDDNIWLTDVAMHQVFKYPAGERKIASLTLGELFTPGTDESHFCKPTDVAVMADGSFFVSDGYCNSRIIQFNSEGHVIRKWGTYGTKAHSRFFIVHSLTLSEELNQLCAADRENKRIQCFDTESHFLYEHPCADRPYALAFKPGTDKMVVAQGDDSKHTGRLSLLHVLSMNSAESMGEFSPMTKKFDVLHDVAVSKDGQSVYVGQLDPPLVYKFIMSIQDSLDNKIDTKTINVNSNQVQHKPIESVDVETSGDNGEEVTSQSVPIIVAILLLVPIACVLIILMAFKIHQARKRKDIHGAFDMGNIFGGKSSRPRGDMSGFAPLTTQEDHYTDSEEEASAERKTFVRP